MVRPIILTTLNRRKYFLNSLNSLEKSNCDLSNLTIYDDCSTDKDKIDALKEVSKTHKVVIRQKNLGTFRNTTFAIEECYNSNDENMVFLQDDIILSKNWLLNGYQIYNELSSRHHVSFLSLFNRDQKCEKKYYIMRMGHPGGVAWIINRNWWDRYRKLYKIGDYGLDKLKSNDKKTMNSSQVKNLVDYKLASRAHDMNWVVARVGRSLVQHIGDHSTISIRNMEQFRSKCFVGEDK